MRRTTRFTRSTGSIGSARSIRPTRPARWAGVGLAVLSALLVGLPTAPAQAAEPDSKATVAAAVRAWQDAPTKTTVTVHQLTTTELKAAGLSRYATPAPLTAAASKATTYPRCFAFNITYSWSFGSWGKVGQNVCSNDGRWVSYTGGTYCSGSGGYYPTYNYEGCTYSTSYGAGWNVSEVAGHWTMCIAYLPWYCANHQFPEAYYQFHPNGAYSLLSRHM